MCHFFKLEGRTAVPISTAEHHQWIAEDPDHGIRRVRADEFLSGDDTVEVSTAFLMGINHSWMDGAEPLLFETMVFGGTMDQSQRRYSTWEQAEAGHQEVLNQLLREMPNLKRAEVYRESVPTRFKGNRDMPLLAQEKLTALALTARVE
jgi:hypothetical protein